MEAVIETEVRAHPFTQGERGWCGWPGCREDETAHATSREHACRESLCGRACEWIAWLGEARTKDGRVCGCARHV